MKRPAALREASLRAAKLRSAKLRPAKLRPGALQFWRGWSIGLRMADRLPPALRARLVQPAGDAVDGAYRLVRQQMKEAVA